MSAKELNIGDYVRTKHYGVCRVIDIYTKELIELDKINAFGIKGVSYSIENIIKSSSNIIDLIEVGDLIKLKPTKQIQQVLAKNEEEIDLTDYVFYDLKKSKQIIKEEIEWVITREQIEQMKYKIGE